MAVNQEFYHHGVKGQKWGVRRYRNADGSLTPAGKKRIAKLNAEVEKTYNKQYSRADKTVSKISDRLKREGGRSATAKEAYKAERAANKMIKAAFIRERKLAEIQSTFTYYEKVRRNEIIANVAMVPLAAVAGGAVFTRTSSPSRNNINRQYRAANRDAKRAYKARVKSEKAKKKMIQESKGS